MQVLDDFWASIKGNAKTRINDPIIGAFVITWVLCNWDRLALLVWGNEKFEVKIDTMVKEMAFFDTPSLLWTNYDLLLLPIGLTILYIFFLPKLAYWVDRKLKPTEIDRHVHSVDIEIDKTLRQKDLNKAKLRGNPQYEFLSEEVKIDLETEKSEAQIRFSEAEVARNEQNESKARATKAEIELEKRQFQAETEKRSLAISAAKQKASLASHRFSSAYLFIKLLSESVQLDNVVMPLNALTRCIATVFGYENFNALLKDKKFTNENLEHMKYVLLDTDRLTKELTYILDEADIEEFDSSWLVGHLEMIFDDLPYDLIFAETLAEKIREEIEINRFELLDQDGVIDGMAETDTIFEEVDGIVIDKYNIEDGFFVVNLSGSASGVHRKESDISGQGIDISIVAKCRAVIGMYGFHEHDVEAYAAPNGYDN